MRSKCGESWRRRKRERRRKGGREGRWRRGAGGVLLCCLSGLFSLLLLVSEHGFEGVDDRVICLTARDSLSQLCAEREHSTKDRPERWPERACRVELQTIPLGIQERGRWDATVGWREPEQNQSSHQYSQSAREGEPTQTFGKPPPRITTAYTQPSAPAPTITRVPQGSRQRRLTNVESGNIDDLALDDRRTRERRASLCVEVDDGFVERRVGPAHVV